MKARTRQPEFLLLFFFYFFFSPCLSFLLPRYLPSSPPVIILYKNRTSPAGPMHGFLSPSAGHRRPKLFGVPDLSRNYVFSKCDHSVRWIPEGRRGGQYPLHPHYLTPFNRWLPSDSVVGGPGIRVGPVWATPGTNPRNLADPR